jgi:CheY-like chemotaxis protein
MTAESALWLAEEWLPDLVLLDLKLNDDLYQGAEVLSRLRDNPATAHLPVVIHSIFVSHQSDLKEVTQLAQGFLTKPFRVDDLRVLIDGLRGAQAPLEPEDT